MKGEPTYSIEVCNELDFVQVGKFIQAFELDNRNLLREQFLVMKQHQNFLAFGRVIEHQTCSEICSLGVIESQRNKGVGKKLMMALVEKAQQPIFIVSVLPDYFISMGFETCDNFPEIMQHKLNYCTGSLPVEEKYVVMKWPNKNELNTLRRSRND